MNSRMNLGGLSQPDSQKLQTENLLSITSEGIEPTTTKDTDFGYQKENADGVSVFTCTNRPKLIDQVFNNYLHQEYVPRELIVVLNNNHMILEEWQNRARQHLNIRVFQLDENISLGECTNYAIQKTSYDYLAKFDDDDYYAPYYLTDMMAAFNYCRADIIGKASRFIYFKSKSTLGFYRPYREFSYVKYVVGATMVFKKHLWEKIKFSDVTEGEDTLFQEECINSGFRIFANDRYNYVTVRDIDMNKHTFKIDDDTYSNCCEQVIPIRNFTPLITR